MNTININNKVLETISISLPELNQEKREIVLPVQFYGFSEVFFIVQSILKASELIMSNCSSDEQEEILSISHNLVTVANKLLSYNQSNFIDELLLPCSHIDTKQIKQI